MLAPPPPHMCSSSVTLCCAVSDQSVELPPGGASATIDSPMSNKNLPLLSGRLIITSAGGNMGGMEGGGIGGAPAAPPEEVRGY